MTEEELNQLIDLVDDVINDATLTHDQVGTGLENIFNKKLMSDEFIQSENFNASVEQVSEKINENIEAIKEAHKRSEDQDKLLGFTRPQTTKLQNLLNELKTKSSNLKKSQERIVDAQSQEIDASKYAATKELEVSELTSRVEDLEKDAKEAGKPVLEDKLNVNSAEMRKVDGTIKVFMAYNAKVAELEAEKANATPDNDKIAKIEAELDKMKTNIKSNKYIQFENDDIATSGTDSFKFEDCLKNNKSINAFINGTIKDASGNAKTNLTSQHTTAWGKLKDDIQSKAAYEALRNLMASKSPAIDIATLTSAQYASLMKELDEKHKTAKTDYMVSKSELDTKKDSVESFRAKQNALAGMTTSRDRKEVQKSWDKYIPDAEKTALMNRSESWRDRFDYWKNDAGKGRISSFFNAFRKRKTQDTMKYNKIQAKRAAIERENKNRSGKFKEELVKLAKTRGSKVTEADKSNLYEKMNESEVIKDQEER